MGKTCTGKERAQGESMRSNISIFETANHVSMNSKGFLYKQRVKKVLTLSGNNPNRQDGQCLGERK